MATIEVFKDQTITILYHEEGKIIHHIMHQQVGGEPFHKAILIATDTLIKHKAKKWLSDDRLNPMLKPSDQKWATDVWQPMILKAGWKYWALVLPAEEAGKLRMSVMASQYEKLGVTAHIYSDPEEGLKWLQSLPD